MKILDITSKIGCKNMCSYCPQDKLVKAYTDHKKQINFSEFQIMMKNVPKDVRINFAGFGEAFLNPESSLMMKYCIQNGYYTTLYTTFTGFTDNDGEILRGLTFESVVFHDYDGFGFNREEFEVKKNKFKKNVNTKNDYQTAIVSQPEKSIKGVDLWSRGGNLFDIKETLNPVVCPASPGETFDHNIALPNGDVVLCCMDFGLKHIIGNLFNTHYNDLDRKSIKILANQRKSDLLCRKCEVARLKYSLPHQITIN